MITWKRRVPAGGLIEVSNSSVLRIDSLERHWSGKYECHASHPFRNESHQIILFAPVTGMHACIDNCSTSLSTP